MHKQSGNNGKVSFSTQCNTAGAEVLYDAVVRLSGVKDAGDTYLVDVCCGTGTIGIYAANASPACKRVVGLDIVPDAVVDARRNAEANGLGGKVEFVTGSAETTVLSALKKLNVFGAGEAGKNVVAIVDPPRGGLRE